MALEANETPECARFLHLLAIGVSRFASPPSPPLLASSLLRLHPRPTPVGHQRQPLDLLSLPCLCIRTHPHIDCNRGRRWHLIHVTQQGVLY